MSVSAGLNRFVWDLRQESIASIPGVYIEGSYDGARVVPGTYKVAFHLDTLVSEKTFQVIADPRITATAADYEKQANLLQDIATDVNDIHVAVVRMRSVQKQLNAIIDRAENKEVYASIVALADSINTKIDEWEEKLIQTKSESNDDVINFVNKLSANYIFLRGELDTNTPHVTSGHLNRFKELRDEWYIYKAQFNSLIEKDIKNFNEKCKALQLPHASLID
jgi:phenylalanyl-tRNA synthetase alpha subunit